MKFPKTDNGQEFVAISKRTIGINVIVGIIVFLLALFSFLHGGWFVILAVLFGLGLCCIIGYTVFLLIMILIVRRASIVEKEALEIEHINHYFSRQRVSLRLGQEKKKDGEPDVD